jgi:8-oxo-dGTP diphosphatase
MVVAAVVEDAHRFLVTRRPPGVHLAGMWEFPGGKIDPAESHGAALRRELREELGVDAEVGELVHQCRLIGEPRPLLGQEMRWVPRAELPSLGFPPADTELIERLVRST